MSYIRILFALCLLIFLLTIACQPTPNHINQIPYRPVEIAAVTPNTFTEMTIPSDNPLTEAGVKLGRYLFYDPILSIDSSQSCASCHHQHRAFTDGLAQSVGVIGHKTRRNAMSLVNIGFYNKGLFWDGRAITLEQQALEPVEDTIELHNTWENVEIRLQGHTLYPLLFRQAFGIKDTSAITKELAVKAIAQFERTLVSGDAKFDKINRGEATFTPSEKRGRDIFFDASEDLPHSECGHCHIDPLFTTNEYHNNGIDSVKTLADFKDNGRKEVSQYKYDAGKFRVPTLRNIALTAPYMHDGRFQTLEEVIAHYKSGGHYAENINPNVRQLQLSEQHQQDLIAFLHTLTDSTFINNPVFSNPFIQQ